MTTTVPSEDPKPRTSQSDDRVGNWQMNLLLSDERLITLKNPYVYLGDVGSSSVYASFCSSVTSLEIIELVCKYIKLPHFRPCVQKILLDFPQVGPLKSVVRTITENRPDNCIFFIDGILLEEIESENPSTVWEFGTVTISGSNGYYDVCEFGNTTKLLPPD